MNLVGFSQNRGDCDEFDRLNGRDFHERTGSLLLGNDGPHPRVFHLDLCPGGGFKDQSQTEQRYSQCFHSKLSDSYVCMSIDKLLLNWELLSHIRRGLEVKLAHIFSGFE